MKQTVLAESGFLLGKVHDGVESKGNSPFFSDHPVSADLFAGRAAQIDHIMIRGVGQVAAGKPAYIFLEGEYGIGKTSIARATQWLAEKNHGLLGIYAALDRAETLEDVGAAVLKATLRSGVYNPMLGAKLRESMSGFIEKQSFFAFNLRDEAIRQDAPNTVFSLLAFLSRTLERVRNDGMRGIFLVLDEINGIAGNPKFAHFLKGLVDLNAMRSFAQPTLPLLLMLCGVKERRWEIVSHHEPVARIFDIVTLERMADEEMISFFRKAFESAHLVVEPRAVDIMTYYAAGFPKIMHLIGNAAYWLDRDGRIDEADALAAIIWAAEEVGKRYVDEQVYAALRSVDYRSILAKIARMGPEPMSFNKAEVAAGLTEMEKKKFNNFLQKMKTLKVLHSGEAQGEYVFNMRMVRLYIWLQSITPKHLKK